MFFQGLQKGYSLLELPQESQIAFGETLAMGILRMLAIILRESRKKDSWHQRVGKTHM